MSKPTTFDEAEQMVSYISTGSRGIRRVRANRKKTGTVTCANCDVVTPVRRGFFYAYDPVHVGRVCACCSAKCANEFQYATGGKP